ncbi:UNVERIFIED_CONTAM: putative mitochondrial protein [Sesamum radiatum]|uniref:Mitochondrial protein n=1 Tax=Sesamum radiatum TaxID=300843 RepID=A0AAW2TI26_SESRA
MLAKQFWRLLTQPESLVGQLLCSRYFPGLSILDAELGHRPSFTWRSIISSKDIILEGYRWRIGNGLKAKIWIDPWIPRAQCFKPRKSIGPLPPPTMVFGMLRYPIKFVFFVGGCVPICFLLARTLHEDSLIWMNRRWEENDMISPEQTILLARNYLAAFSVSLEPHHSLNSLPVSTTWTAPTPGSIKINSDAAIFQSDGDFGVGVIARNSNGHCLTWSSASLHRRVLPEVAEAWAARIAIQFAHRFGWTDIVIETDCASLHSQLISSTTFSSHIGPIVFYILSLATGFNSCRFSLICRTGNSVAHSLARYVVSWDEGTTLLPSPTCTLALVDLPD